MNSAERRIEFPPHLIKWQRESRAPPDQHIIVAGVHDAAIGKPHDLPQAAPHPVALHGVADLPRHRESDTHGTLVPARARLQYEGAGRCSRPARCGAKVGPARQPLHGEGDGNALTH
jgi:hypothetical protein